MCRPDPGGGRKGPPSCGNPCGSVPAGEPLPVNGNQGGTQPGAAPPREPLAQSETAPVAGPILRCVPAPRCPPFSISSQEPELPPPSHPTRPGRAPRPNPCTNCNPIKADIILLVFTAHQGAAAVRRREKRRRGAGGPGRHRLSNGSSPCSVLPEPGPAPCTPLGPPPALQPPLQPRTAAAERSSPHTKPRQLAGPHRGCTEPGSGTGHQLQPVTGRWKLQSRPPPETWVQDRDFFDFYFFCCA